MSNPMHDSRTRGVTRVGILGGTFDPVHNGHLAVARAAKERLVLDKVFLVPAFAPPHKGDAKAPGRDRLAMVRLAVADEPGLCADDVELSRGGVSYSIDTVRAFRERLGPEARLWWIIGADTTPELATWKDVRELARLCTFAPVTRPGWTLDALETLRGVMDDVSIAAMREHLISIEGVDVSSSEIRERVASGESVDALVPPAVARYIREHRLYAHSAAEE